MLRRGRSQSESRHVNYVNEFDRFDLKRSARKKSRALVVAFVITISVGVATYVLPSWLKVTAGAASRFVDPIASSVLQLGLFSTAQAATFADRFGFGSAAGPADRSPSDTQPSTADDARIAPEKREAAVRTKPDISHARLSEEKPAKRRSPRAPSSAHARRYPQNPGTKLAKPAPNVDEHWWINDLFKESKS